MTISLNPFGKAPNVRIRWLPEIADGLLPRFKLLARDLDLVRKARAEGAENRPATEDRDLDAIQRDVGTAVVEGVNLLRQFLGDQLHRAKEQIQPRFPGRIDPQIALIEARAAVQEAKHSRGEQLRTLSLDEHRKRRQIRKFRADNALSRDASYASHPLVPWSILIAMIAAEMGVNAMLFAKTNAMGYVGGASQALLFGLVNVAIGFGAGFLGLRLIGHVKVGLKLLGLLIFLTTLCCGLCWNLKVAHYREFVEQNAGSDFITPGSLVPSLDWLSLTSIESWALLFFGLFVFVLAVVEGRGGRGGFCDPYPGYRAVDLAHLETETAYRTGKDEYRSAIRAAIDAVRVDLRKRISGDAARIEEIVEISSAATTRTQEVRDSIGEWIAMGASLLRLYREENEKVRTAAAPDYFRTYPAFANVAQHVADASDVRLLAEAAEQQHSANIAALSRAEADLVRFGVEEAERFLAEIDAIEEGSEERLQEEWRAPTQDGRPPLASLTQIRRAG